MAKTIFAGKQVEKLSLEQVLAILRSGYTELPGFFEHFFFCYSPGYTCYWYRQNKYPIYRCIHFNSFNLKHRILNFVIVFRWKLAD